jgi:hypothetical protein
MALPTPQSLLRFERVRRHRNEIGAHSCLHTPESLIAGKYRPTKSPALRVAAMSPS